MRSKKKMYNLKYLCLKDKVIHSTKRQNLANNLANNLEDNRGILSF